MVCKRRWVRETGCRTHDMNMTAKANVSEDNDEMKCKKEGKVGIHYRFISTIMFVVIITI